MAQAGSPGAAFRKSTVREYFESVCVAVILALFVRTFVVQAFKIPTGSMENNLLIGDHLLVNKFLYAPTALGLEEALLPIEPIRRFDVLVFKYPVDPERDFVKRVIGLPGETIEVREGDVYVNGMKLDDEFGHRQYTFLGGGTANGEGDLRTTYGPVTVPADQYFMMGDNRDNSEDSRYWGFLPRDHVKGKALFVYFSFGDGRDADTGPFGVRWSRLLHQIH